MENNIEERLLGSEEEGRSDPKWRIWVESKKIWRVAAPALLARMSQFGLVVVTQSFIGHISELDLAAYALVSTITLRFAIGILMGMSSATETLCGQAFGAGQHHMMGIYLQRSWIIDSVTVTIFLPLFIFATQIFELLGEETAIAKVAERSSFWFIPFLYSYMFTLTIQMYLQAQLKNKIIAWLAAASFFFHLVLSWLFVTKLNFGIPGALGALNISNWLLAFGEFVYIFGGWCPLSWQGFSKAAFSDLWPLLKLSVASGVMICLEVWYYSILVLIAGYMSDAEIAISAFSICLNINAWQFMMFVGFLGASCVRVANELGRGDAKAVKFSIKVILSTSIMLGVVFCILCSIFGRTIGYLFSSNEEVVETVADLSMLLALTMLFNSIQPVLTGVAVGAGLQGTVAIINLCCYYVIGIPLGILLAYASGLGIKGIWIGMLLGNGVQINALAYMVWRTDWDLQVRKAAERMGRWFLKPSKESDENLNHT